MIDFQRYDLSLIWDYHSEYFKKNGLRPWQYKRIPFKGVTSYEEAFKKASLFFENFIINKPDIELRDLYIIEFGAGNGDLCLNFMSAFSDILRSSNIDYQFKVYYYLTDFSETVVDGLVTKFKNFQNPNFVLSVWQLDVVKDHFFCFNQKFDMALSTYVMDQLPARVIYKKDANEFREKYLALANRKYNFWGLKRIKRQIKFKQCFPEETMPAWDWQVLLSCFRKNKPSTIVYSYVALEFVKKTIDILNNNGILVFSDFNAAARGWMDNYEPCYYAGSLAQGVNFNFLYKYFQDLNKVILFEDPVKPLHTLILSKANNSEAKLTLGEVYTKVFKVNSAYRIIYKYLIEMKFALSIYFVILIIVILFCLNY